MADKKQKNEVRQMRFLLERIAELAEHAENTGTFEDGAKMSARRYNRIIEALEEQGILPEDIFSSLDDSVPFSLLGAEARLLKEYLDEYGDGDEGGDEDGERGRRRRERNRDRERSTGEDGPDLGLITAIAPFMEQGDLSRLVSRHFAHAGTEWEEKGDADASLPSLKEIVNLAPFVERATLQALLEAYIARGGQVEARKLAELAPFLPREFFGPFLHRNFPHWFSKETPAPPPLVRPESDEREVVVFHAKTVADDQSAG